MSNFKCIYLNLKFILFFYSYRWKRNCSLPEYIRTKKTTISEPLLPLLHSSLESVDNLGGAKRVKTGKQWPGQSAGTHVLLMQKKWETK